MTRSELQTGLALADREHFRKAFLLPALADGLVERTIPDKPQSRLQRYRLTPKGQSLVQAETKKDAPTRRKNG